MYQCKLQTLNLIQTLYLCSLLHKTKSKNKTSVFCLLSLLSKQNILYKKISINIV